MAKRVKKRARAKKRAGRDGEPLLTRRQLAKILDVHDITIMKWQRAGFAPELRGRRGKPSLYLESKARAFLQAREDAAKATGPLDPAQERAHKDHWDCLLKKQKHAVNARQLVPAAETERRWAQMTAAARERLLAIPSTALQRGIVSTVDQEEQLIELVDEALAELAERTVHAGA